MTVLLHKIMDYFHLELLILSIISCRVFGETSWESAKARYDGYDLQRGPVFYEAYYPNDNRPNPREAEQFQRIIKPETQTLNGGSMMEKIYQTAGGSPMNTASWKTDDLKSQAPVDRYYTPRNDLTGSNFNEAKNNRQIQKQDSRSIRNRRFDEEYINPILSAIENSAREILVKELEKLSEIQDTTGNVKISRSPDVAELENQENDRRQVSMRNSDSPSRPNQPGSFDQRFQSGDWKNWRANDFFADHNRLEEPDFRSPVPRKPLVPGENHFQPQASNYVMGATIVPTREQSFVFRRGPAVQLPQPLTPNDWQARNPIDRNAEIRKSNENTEKSNEIVPGVASIEISEMPRHKIRHHHGEKPRHNKHRRHAPGY